MSFMIPLPFHKQTVRLGTDDECQNSVMISNPNSALSLSKLSDWRSVESRCNQSCFVPQMWTPLRKSIQLVDDLR